MRPAPMGHAHRPGSIPERIPQHAPLRPRRPARLLAAIAALAAMALPGAAAAIDLGDASVLSRQGQRLQIAIPFGSDPGERVAATRFSVVSVEAPGAGADAPDPRRFTISRPERRNVVYLRSERPVENDRLRIVVSVSGLDGEGTGAAYDILIPPLRLTPPAKPRAPRSPRR